MASGFPSFNDDEQDPLAADDSGREDPGLRDLDQKGTLDRNKVKGYSVLLAGLLAVSGGVYAVQQKVSSVLTERAEQERKQKEDAAKAEIDRLALEHQRQLELEAAKARDAIAAATAGQTAAETSAALTKEKAEANARGRADGAAWAGTLIDDQISEEGFAAALTEELTKRYPAGPEGDEEKRTSAMAGFEEGAKVGIVTRRAEVKANAETEARLMAESQATRERTAREGAEGETARLALKSRLEAQFRQDGVAYVNSLQAPQLAPEVFPPLLTAETARVTSALDAQLREPVGGAFRGGAESRLETRHAELALATELAKKNDQLQSLSSQLEAAQRAGNRAEQLRLVGNIFQTFSAFSTFMNKERTVHGVRVTGANTRVETRDMTVEEIFRKIVDHFTPGGRREDVCGLPNGPFSEGRCTAFEYFDALIAAYPDTFISEGRGGDRVIVFRLAPGEASLVRPAFLAIATQWGEHQQKGPLDYAENVLRMNTEHPRGE